MDGHSNTGGAYYIDGHIGGALWLPPGVHPDGDALDDLFLKSLSKSHHDALVEIFGQMEGYHPSEPHWHLTMIGVDPLECHKGTWLSAPGGGTRSM